MKAVSISIILLLVFVLPGFCQFYADDKVRIDEAEDDVYAAGETVIVETIVKGDFLGAGNNLKINDRVEEDLIIAGGDLDLNSSVGDDARIAGGNIRVFNVVEDDLVVFGGEFYLEPEALVKGNLIFFGGEAEIQGDVEGDVKIYGGDIKLDGDIGGDLDVKGGELEMTGRVKGKSTIAVKDLDLKSGAEFNDDVRYWSENEDYDIEDYMVSGEARFDDDLAYSEDREWNFGGGEGRVFWWVLQLIMVAISAMIFNTLFPGAFRKVQKIVKVDAGRSFGYGILYLLITPLLCLFLIVIIIGIPVGLSVLTIYGLTLIFATTIVALVASYYLDEYYHRNWNTAEIVGIAVLCFAVLKVIGLIPYVGWIFKTLLVAIVFGAFILLIIDKKRWQEDQVVPQT